MAALVQSPAWAMVADSASRLRAAAVVERTVLERVMGKKSILLAGPQQRPCQCLIGIRDLLSRSGTDRSKRARKGRAFRAPRWRGPGGAGKRMRGLSRNSCVPGGNFDPAAHRKCSALAHSA